MSDPPEAHGDWLIHEVSHTFSRSAHFYVSGVLPTAACGFTDSMAKFGAGFGMPELESMYREPARGTPRCQRCEQAIARLAQ